MKRSPMSPGKPLQRGKPMNRGTSVKPTTAISKKRSTLNPSRLTHTAEEDRHLARVAALGCVVCSECLGIEGTPAIVHHLRTAQGKMRASHMDTLPVCPAHHQDSGEGIHDMGRRQFAEKYGQSEVQLLHAVQRRLGVPLWQSPYLTTQRQRANFTIQPEVEANA